MKARLDHLSPRIANCRHRAIRVQDPKAEPFALSVGVNRIFTGNLLIYRAFFLEMSRSHFVKFVKAQAATSR